MKLYSQMRMTRGAASCGYFSRFLILLAALAAGVSVYGQDSGRIQGRVQDAIEGRYMESVTVTVSETGGIARTTSDGTFRITGLSSGTYTLSVEHIGYFGKTVMVEVSAGDVAKVETIKLRSRNTFDEDSDDVFELDAFEVSGEADGFSRALNQQRVSDYNVNVVDSGTFGDVTEGNVGEFVKFLPGVNINYVAADARTITVRGMADNFTAVTVDGNKMASASSGAKARDFELEQLSINNVERVEVAKVPTADMSADSLGGAVNLVSKSAFERDGREIKYRAYVSANSEDLTLSKTPGWGDEKKRKIYGGFDFTYADVFQDGALGVIFNYTNSNQFNEQHRTQPRWVTDNSTSGGGVGEPILQRYLIQDGPKFTHRESFHVKTDYKLSDNTILSASLQFNDYSSEFRNRNITWDTNVTGTTDSDADGDGYITADEIRTDTGRGDIDMGGSWRDKNGNTWHGDFGIKHYGDVWTYDVGGYSSVATNNYQDFSHGMIMAIAADYDFPGQLSLSDFGDPYARDVVYTPNWTLYNTDGSVATDYGVGDLSKFRLREVQTREQDSEDSRIGIHADMKRNIRIGEHDGYFKTGVSYGKQDRDAKRNRTRITYNGSFYGMPAEEYYSGQDALYLGPGIIEWPDYGELYDVYTSDLASWDPMSDSRYKENVEGLANDVYVVSEKISAAYVMSQLKFLNSRLKVTGGLRYEKTDLEGEGALFDESLGGTLPDGPEKYAIQWGTRKLATSSYDDIYASLNGVYDINEQMLVRLSFAQTIGRPDFGAIIPYLKVDRPGLTEQEADGSVEFNNTALNPFAADTYDLTFEYYPKGGGLMSASIFRKNIDGSLITENGLISDLSSADFARYGLPSSLADHPEYSYSTTQNGGTAELDGLELSIYQPLNGILPDWARGFSLNANATINDVKFDKEGDGVIYDELEDMVKETYNFGLTYDRDPVKLQLKWNSKGEQFVSTTTALRTFASTTSTSSYVPFNLYRARLKQFDVNLDIDITKHATFFVSGRNIFGEPQNQFIANQDRSIMVAERSEEFGVQWAIGVKGKF